jgi:NH3-dependent NAD+ synthetase
MDETLNELMTKQFFIFLSSRNRINFVKVEMPSFILVDEDNKDIPAIAKSMRFQCSNFVEIEDEIIQRFANKKLYIKQLSFDQEMGFLLRFHADSINTKLKEGW